MWIACLLADAQRGTVTGSPPTLSTETLQQTWSLDQLGNWSNVKLDLTNDGDWADAGEYDDNRTHNVVNELTNRDLDGSGGSGPNYALTYGGNGELATDGHEYEYSWDAWGRLVSVYSIIADAVVSDFEYNGLGWQKSFTEAIAGGGTATFWNTHDHQGRTLQTRRGTDASGGGAAWFKVRYVYHNAGHAGSGSSSYRNAIVLRDADMTNGWTGAADGTLEARHYYCQNYRGDVVALITDAGQQAEHVRYDPYGLPTCLPAGDTDSDGDFDSNDVFTGCYDIRKDVDLDGDNDVFDAIAASNINGGYVALGRGVLSHDSKHHNRLGWQGSEHASTTPARLTTQMARNYHVLLGIRLHSSQFSPKAMYSYRWSPDIGDDIPVFHKLITTSHTMPLNNRSSVYSDPNDELPCTDCLTKTPCKPEDPDYPIFAGPCPCTPRPRIDRPASTSGWVPHPLGFTNAQTQASDPVIPVWRAHRSNLRVDTRMRCERDWGYFKGTFRATFTEQYRFQYLPFEPIIPENFQWHNHVTIASASIYCQEGWATNGTPPEATPPIGISSTPTTIATGKGTITVGADIWKLRDKNLSPQLEILFRGRATWTFASTTNTGVSLQLGPPWLNIGGSISWQTAPSSIDLVSTCGDGWICRGCTNVPG